MCLKAVLIKKKNNLCSPGALVKCYRIVKPAWPNAFFANFETSFVINNSL